ncbi:glycoside hydrolase family 5 protein [Roseibium sediminis]|uniref:glycoside hydrolase family 5 protein n=1 Tax=Roseibium sediminis TaxID=1775174 RepID=UPI001AD8CE5A|nr:glycoside hydrolase family 5 protein [Roseibium sediminis]
MKPSRLLRAISVRAMCALLSLAMLGAGPAQAMTCLRGVNIAGAEFGSLPGVFGTNYIYPTDETLDHFAGLGVNTVRFPFRWERLQTSLHAPFDADELGRLTDVVERITARGMKVVLSPHNFAEYGLHKIGTGNVTIEAFADFWARLAPLFANRDDVIYLLMNEPIEVTAATWLEATNASIAAIRKAGASNMIMVPGTLWTGAVHWFDEQEGGSNADLLTGVVDPLNNYVFDIHQYLDENFSGTNLTCPRTDDAIAALRRVEGWFRDKGYVGFLGEFGGTSSPDCLQGMAEVILYLNRNSDVWIGWTAWAAGEWWGDYYLSLQPTEAGDRPQTKLLSAYWKPVISEPDNCAALQQPVREQ